MSTRPLLIRPKTTVWMSHPRHLDLIEPLPEGVRVVDRPELATTRLGVTPRLSRG